MDELDLYDRKWFDYRLASPALANLYFLRDYIKELRNFNEVRQGHSFINPVFNYKTEKDPKTNRQKRIKQNGKLINLVDFEDLPGTFPHYIHADTIRRYCDSHGYKYGEFCRTAFEAMNTLRFRIFFLNYMKNSKVLQLTKKIINESGSGLIRLSQDEYFKPNNWKDEELQNDYYFYVLNSLKNKYGGGYKRQLKLVLDEVISSDFLIKHTKENVC